MCTVLRSTSHEQDAALVVHAPSFHIAHTRHGGVVDYSTLSGAFVLTNKSDANADDADDNYCKRGILGVFIEGVRGGVLNKNANVAASRTIWYAVGAI